MNITKVAIVAFLVFVWPSQPLRAQSVESCLSSSGPDATALCQQILNKGSRNASVYEHLASQHYEAGNTDNALRVLREALSIHPGNRELNQLVSTIEYDAEEKRLLNEAQKKNPTRIYQGGLKISCLAKTSQEGMEACKNYLELTDVDGDKIRARLSVLESKLKPIVEPIVYEPLPTIEEPDDSAIATVTPPLDQEATDNNTSENVDQSATLNAYQGTQAYTLALETQTILNELGFNTGTPDGIPGARTQRAIDQFYQTIAKARPINIDANLVAELNKERTSLRSARELVKSAESQYVAGNAEAAEITLDEAILTSRLLPPQTALKESIRKSRLQEKQNQDNILAEQREAELQAQAKRETELQAQAKREAELQAQAKSEAELQAQAKREAELQAQAKREAELQAQVQREAELQAQAKREAELQAQAQAQREAELQAQAQREAELQAQAQRESELQAQAAAIALVPSPNATESVAQLNSLMQQIQGIESRLADQQSATQERMAQVRSAVLPLFD